MGLLSSYAVNQIMHLCVMHLSGVNCMSPLVTELKTGNDGKSSSQGQLLVWKNPPKFSEPTSAKITRRI